MWAYWLAFLVPVIFSFFPLRGDQSIRNFSFLLVVLVYGLMIGTRHEVGADWYAYLDYFKAVHGVGVIDAMALNDPAYMLLNWISDRLDAGIYGVNFICGLVFMCGLVRFCQRQPLPWLALVVSIPYLLIVVTMGYSRQGVALGFVLLALCELENKRILRFSMLVICGALFHKSAVVVLLLIQVQKKHRSSVEALFALVLIVTVGGVLVLDSIQAKWQGYVEAQMQSDGGAIRIWMDVVPAFFILYFRKKWRVLWPNAMSIWVALGIAAVFCIPLQMLASTATDRLALYIAPIQLVVYSRLPLLVNGHWRVFVFFSIIALYAFVLFIWINFSHYASEAWLPYRSILF